MKKKYNIRAICAKIIIDVLKKQLSLNTVLPKWNKKISDKDRALLQELSFGVLRFLPFLKTIVDQLIIKQLKGKKQIIYYLIIIGIYQLNFTRIPPYAVLSETVNSVVVLKYFYFKSLINAVLRQFQFKKKYLINNINVLDHYYSHPKWLFIKIKETYPIQWKEILETNNHKAPMWIRVNQKYHNAHEYLILLNKNNIKANISNESNFAIKLQKPCKINELPGFFNGWVSIQDISSQKCVEALSPKNNEYILDMCAAPGSKTTYILEIAPKAKIFSIDINKKRIELIYENLNRFNLHSVVILGDGSKPKEWIPKIKFDRILLDPPCSGTGVIRRHPDIKWLRKPTDILNLVKLQYKIFEAIWPFLKKNGILVYSTCSILPEENIEQINKFLLHHSDASYLNFKNKGEQILQTKNGGDGFFFSILIKK